MNHRASILFLSAALAAALAAAQGQRIVFPRHSFDRSRFAQPAAQPAAAPAAPAVSPAPADNPALAPSGSSSSYPSSSYSSSSYSSSSNAASGRVPDELVASPRWDLVPRKETDNPKDYPALLELQRQSGAVLLVYFKNANNSNEKGLCSWFEKAIAGTRDWQKATRPYIKLTVNLPGNSAAAEIAARYRVAKTPFVAVHKPNSMPMRLSVIEWINKDPKPRPVEDVISDLLKLSTEAYQTYVPTIR